MMLDEPQAMLHRGTNVQERHWLVNVIDDGELVLRSDFNDILIVEAEDADVECFDCGRFAQDVAPCASDGRWRCYATDPCTRERPERRLGP